MKGRLIFLNSSTRTASCRGQVFNFAGSILFDSHAAAAIPACTSHFCLFVIAIFVMIFTAVCPPSLASWAEELALLDFIGGPNGSRTRVLALRGLCPRPLDDGTRKGGYTLLVKSEWFKQHTEDDSRTYHQLLFTDYCRFGWGERIRTPVSRSRVCRPAPGRLPKIQ